MNKMTLAVAAMASFSLAACETLPGNDDPVADDPPPVIEDTTPTEAPTAHQSYRPLPNNIMLVWDADDVEGQPQKLTQIVVGSGESATVFWSKNDIADMRAENFFVEYQGIYWVSCDVPAPSAEDLAALKAVWPLKVGNSADLNVPDGSTFAVSKVSISAEEKDFIPDIGEMDVFQIDTTLAGGDVDRAYFSPALSTSTQINWSTGGEERLIAIRRAEDSEQLTMAQQEAARHCVIAE